MRHHWRPTINVPMYTNSIFPETQTSQGKGEGGGRGTTGSARVLYGAEQRHHF